MQGLSMETDAQLVMGLFREGGTGKSWVINAIWESNGIKTSIEVMRSFSQLRRRQLL